MDFTKSISKFFDLVLGLPMHPLVVHGVVVLVPLFALYVGFRVIKNRSITRNTIVIGLILLLISSASRLSGEALASRIGYESIKETGHLTAGNFYPFAVLSFLILVWLYNRSLQRRRNFRWWLTPVTKGLVLVSSIGLLLFTLWTGHTGATSHWQGVKDYTEFGDQKP